MISMFDIPVWTSKIKMVTKSTQMDVFCRAPMSIHCVGSGHVGFAFLGLVLYVRLLPLMSKQVFSKSVFELLFSQKNSLCNRDVEYWYCHRH